MRRRIVVIANPVASEVTEARIARVEEVFSRVGTCTVRRTERRLHATELAREAAEDGVDAVVAMGGDGTMNEVVNGAGSRVPIGLLPCGGTSVLARALGLPRGPLAAARQVADALEQGREQLLYPGLFNGRRFGFAAGIGLDAEIVRRVDARGRPNSRRPPDAAFAAELARAVTSGGYRAPVMTIRTRDREERAAFVIIANVDPWTYVGPLPLHVAPMARPELGFDLVIVRRLRLRDITRLLSHLTLGPALKPDRDSQDLLYLHDLREATIVCDRPLPAELDGEDIGDVERVDLAMDEHAIRFLV